MVIRHALYQPIKSVGRAVLVVLLAAVIYLIKPGFQQYSSIHNEIRSDVLNANACVSDTISATPWVLSAMFVCVVLRSSQRP
jgi:ABC-type antimicrobial peptide transport system permease subunit